MVNLEPLECASHHCTGAVDVERFNAILALRHVETFTTNGMSSNFVSRNWTAHTCIQTLNIHEIRRNGLCSHLIVDSYQVMKYTSCKSF